MDYQVIINPELGGSNTGKTYNGESEKNYNLKFGKLLSDKLTSIGIKNILVRTSDKDMSFNDRINYINTILNNSPNSIIVSNGLGSDDIEIIYGLKNKDTLASRLANNFYENNFVVSKYYQRRDPNNTNIDYEPLIRDIRNESIIIRLGDISSDNNIINNRINDLVSVIADTLKSYLGLSNDTYIVKKGDNLYSIARMFNTTVADIKKLNNLTSNNLSIGQKILVKSIPSTIVDTDKYYIVKKGDNLYSIANKYNITVLELKNLNSLKSNILTVGQKLIIPTITDSNTYKVVNGDTLYSIARRYNISVDELKKLNNLTSNNLSIGQSLKIPKDNIVEYRVKKGDTLYSIAAKYNTTIKDIMNLNNLKNTNLSLNQLLIIPI